MKAIFLFLLIVFDSSMLVAQNRDNTWILGNQLSGNNLGLDFSNNELDTFTPPPCLRKWLCAVSQRDGGGVKIIKQ